MRPISLNLLGQPIVKSLAPKLKAIKRLNSLSRQRIRLVGDRFVKGVAFCVNEAYV